MNFFNLLLSVDLFCVTHVVIIVVFIFQLDLYNLHADLSLIWAVIFFNPSLPVDLFCEAFTLCPLLVLTLYNSFVHVPLCLMLYRAVTRLNPVC